MSFELPQTSKGASLELSSDAEERIQKILTHSDMSSVMTWVDQHMATYSGSESTDDQPFRAFYRKGDDSDTTVAVFGEFANGAKSVGAAVRGIAVQQAVSPDANILYLPNTATGETNLNFSKPERLKLSKGNLSPMLARIAVTLEANQDNAGTIVAFGPSQGALPALMLGIERDHVATAVIEAPHLEERSTVQLAKDFVGSGADLKSTIGANFASESKLSKELTDELTTLGFIKYGLGIPTRDNFALMRAMRHNAGEDAIFENLKRENSVVSAYGTEDRVSSNSANAAIARFYNPRFERFDSVEVTGAGHDVTNNYRLAAALSVRALELLAVR